MSSLMEGIRGMMDTLNKPSAKSLRRQCPNPPPNSPTTSPIPTTRIPTREQEEEEDIHKIKALLLQALTIQIRRVLARIREEQDNLTYSQDDSDSESAEELIFPCYDGIKKG